MWLHYPVNEDRNEIGEDVRKKCFFRRERNITFQNIIVGNENKAKAHIINESEMSPDEIFAVKYRDYEKVLMTKRYYDLKARKEKLLKRKKEFCMKHLARMKRAEYVGCKSCGSRLKKKLLGDSNICPVCYENFYSEAVVNKIIKYKMKIDEINRRMDEECDKLKDKAEVKWLIQTD